MADWIVDLGLGLLLGGIGGIFGIGGGLLAIPTLVWLGMPQALAQGTALVMIAPNVLLGFIRYRQRNDIVLSQCVVLGISALLTSYISAKLAIGLSGQYLQSIFAGFLLVLAGMILWGDVLRTQGGQAKAVLGMRALSVLGMLSGLCAGIFTVGGGLVLVPVLMRWFGIQKQTVAQGMGLASVVPGAFASLMAYALAEKIDWQVGLPLAAGGLMSMSLGVALAHALPERLLRWAFCGLLCATAVAMW